ncbi:hypothetical protein QYE76_053913 [Lolium multiflorum]|uniref:Reverse transcriptase Ty1/copia-type domain-containing protein n=1 Tax=Lolium multiflorum TaxID=4521 RepID=A0AAD8WKJ1_LOLMU|nr:hypothetical protein QYE76_053913 [Lolium multiflorum]
MIRELKVIFETHAAVESYEASKQFLGCMMEAGSSVSEHVFAMSGHARKLSDLGIVIPNQLGHRKLNCPKYLADLKSGLVKKKKDNNDEDPATYEETMMSPDSNKWQEAMKSEMGSMYDNKVWTLVDLPDSRKAVENKWIFKRKTDADGNVTVYKADLSQRVSDKFKMDVKTAFLNGDIEEELYMVQPKGFVDPKNVDKSGYVFILNGAAVSWCSSKQCTVVKSSTSEYIAARRLHRKRMNRFIVELGVVPSALDPLVIYCDNMGAIANAQEPRSHKKLKHIKLRFHSIREYIEDGEVKICKYTLI